MQPCFATIPGRIATIPPGAPEVGGVKCLQWAAMGRIEESDMGDQAACARQWVFNLLGLLVLLAVGVT